MRDLPRDCDLLEIARTALQQEVTPQLSGSARHAAMMIANALGIVARQLRATMPDVSELASLDALLGHVPSQPSPQRLECLNRELGSWIRSNGAQNEQARKVYRHLLATTEALVQESNPKYLQEQHPGAA